MVLGCLQDRQMQGFIPEVGDPAMVSFWFLPTSFALRANKLITAPCSCASIGEPVGFAPSVKCRISFLLEAFKYLGMYVNGDLSTLPLPCSQSLSTVWPARSGKDSTTGSGGHLFVTVFRAYLYIFHLWEYLFKWWHNSRLLAILAWLAPCSSTSKLSEIKCIFYSSNFNILVMY